MERKMICRNTGINENGHLTFAGQDVTALAKEFKTPLYLMDEARIRENCRVYTEAFGKYFPKGSKAVYASKACSFKEMYRIMKEENMFIDTVSAGEIYTARAAGFPMENVIFHGNNKTREDIAFAMDLGVGYFAADNLIEINNIEAHAAFLGKSQKVLLRVTPGIDPHTYEAVSTGKVDSKFGAAIETGQAEELTCSALEKEHISLAGFHCHVGSQVFGEDIFERAAKVMLTFIRDIYKKYGFTCGILNLGGGYGVRYVASDPHINISERLKSLAETVNTLCEELDIEQPAIFMEPGRSIAADAGMTVYTAGNVKRIPGFKTYVSVDGGMSDNPRYALYKSSYTCLAAGKMDEECSLSASLVGRCCESGDILQENVLFPESISEGDIIAVCTTGAYNYSMASNYNRLGRPPVVMITKDGNAKVVVKRETLDDLIRLDV